MIFALPFIVILAGLLITTVAAIKSHKRLLVLYAGPLLTELAFFITINLIREELPPESVMFFGFVLLLSLLPLGLYYVLLSGSHLLWYLVQKRNKTKHTN